MRTLPVVATLAAAALLLAGCSGSASSTSSTAPALYDPAKLVSTTTAGKTAVDTVTWGLKTGEPTSLDPVKTGTDSQYIVMANMCESVLTVDPSFAIKDNLATSADWDASGNFVIDLRAGVTFWDGTPLTADDVVYSLKRTADPTSGSIATAAFSRVASITATGPLQVTVTFSTPDSQFRNAMAGPAGYVFEKAYTEQEGASLGVPGGGLMCTGPYALASWTSGSGIELRANPSYWNGAPLVSHLKFVFVDSDATLTSALLNGEIDGAYDVPVAAVSQLEASGAGSVYVGPSNASASFGPTTSTGPAADPKVREALSMAIDRTSYIATVLGGYGEVGKTFTPPFQWEGLADAAVYQAGYDALPAPTYDLDGAKKLIKEANLTTTSLTIAVPAGDQQTLQSATVVQAAGAQIGLDIAVKQLPGTQFASLFYDPSARAGIDLVATTGYLDTPGAYAYASLFALPDGLFNWSSYSDDQVTQLLGDGRGAADQTTAAQKFVAAQAIFAPDYLQVTLGIQYTRIFLSKKLTGTPTSLAFLVTPWAAHLGGR